MRAWRSVHEFSRSIGTRPSSRMCSKEVGEGDEANVALDRGGQTLRQSYWATEFVVAQGDEDLDVRAVVMLARRRRSEQDRERHVRLRA